MTVSLNEIKKPIEKELAAFEIMFRQSMKTKVPLLDTIMTYIVKSKGKQIRPLFVMFSAKLFGEINIRTYRGASMVELLHTATLVHDDVVDDSSMRRMLFGKIKSLFWWAIIYCLKVCFFPLNIETLTS
jgi:octaprenyl-diphosphate synthase